MRKLFFGILIFLAANGYTQDYKLNYAVHFHMKTGCGLVAERRASLTYNTINNNTERPVPGFYFVGISGSPLFTGIDTMPLKDGPIKTLWLTSFYRLAGDMYPFCIRTHTVIYKNPDTLVNVHNTFDLAKRGINWGCIEDCSDSIIVNTFNLIPSLSIEAIDNKEKMLPTDDKIKLKATASFPKNIYKWQYGTTDLKLGTVIWKDLPIFNGDSIIQMSATDILADFAQYMVGQSIFFRIDMGNDFYSNKVTLNIQRSSPHITSLIPLPPKCFGEMNGSAKIQFDRELMSNELLSIILSDSATGAAVSGSKYNLIELEAGNIITLDSKLASGKYKIGLNGSYPDTLARTYTSGPQHKAFFEIKSPSAVSFSITKQNDVRCYGDNDGTIKITATGGVGTYKVGYKKASQTDYTWQNFSTATTHTLNSLDTGIYSITVRDANGCFEKDMSNNEKTRIQTITQPAEPIKIDFSKVSDPLGFGRTDGNIKVIVKGGTPKTGSTYNITWKKLDGTVLSSLSNTTVATGYQTVLQNIGKGKYILNVTDSNFTIAASGATQGCMLTDTFTVNEPPPISININTETPISCKGDANGAIVAHASGGVPFGPDTLYYYKWFKREATDIDLGKTDSLATNLKAGNYIVKIIDKNKIEKISDVFVLTEPDSLKIQFTTSVTACTSKGNITATITGGTAPYHIEWTTGDTTTTISNLIAGNYLAYVKDAHGCAFQASTKLQIPNAITIDNALTQNPSYYNSKDGFIQLTISGGTLPYTYNWNNGATTKDIQSVAAGTYSVTITDATGCTQTKNYSLQNPPRVIQIGGVPLDNGISTKTLCNGQHLDVDATIADNAAVYTWNSNNGFTANTAKVTLTSVGKYWITITDSRGINASDTLIIAQNNANISARFVVTTQAFTGEKVTFVNISDPAASDHIRWIIPNDPKIEILQNDQNLAELIFKDTGTYTISMKAFVGECEQLFTKKVIVVQGQSFDDIGAVQNPYIKKFSIMPNPSNGQFNVKVVLQEQGKIRIRMTNVSNSAIVIDKELLGSSQYMIPYKVSVAPGIYILLLETAKGIQIQKVIIN